ncbi:MAG: alpha/beta hydrolase [Gemmatimonadaceae bacterium]
MSNVFGERLPRSQWYPANEPLLSARFLELSGGERVRLVEGGARDAPPVLLVHGWGCSAYAFRKLMMPLAEAGYRPVAIDLRGHGASDKPADERKYSAESMAEFLLGVLDALHVSRVPIVAHSMGAGVVLDAASQHPERVSSLALIAPVGLAPVRGLSMARRLTPPAAASLLPYAMPRWSVPWVLRAVYGPTGKFRRDEVDQYWAPTQDPAFAASLRMFLHAYRFDRRSDEQLGRISAPTSVLLGGLDVLIRSRQTARRAATLAGWSVRTLERAGHVLAEEVPDEVLAMVLPLLAINR